MVKSTPSPFCNRLGIEGVTQPFAQQVVEQQTQAPARPEPAQRRAAPAPGPPRNRATRPGRRVRATSCGRREARPKRDTPGPALARLSDVLAPDQLASLQRDGFVNAGPVLSSDEVDAIAGEYDRLVTLEAQTLGTPEAGLYPYRAMLNFRSDALRRFLNHPALLAIAQPLLGDDLRFWWD